MSERGAAANKQIDDAVAAASFALAKTTQEQHETKALDRANKSNAATWGLLGGSLLVLTVLYSPLAVVMGGTLVAVFGVRFVKVHRDVRRYFVDQQDGLAALARGDLDAARELFVYWIDRTGSPVVAALARYHLAWTKLRQGSTMDALSLFQATERRYTAWLRGVKMQVVIAIDLGLTYALAGDLDNAERMLGEARRRAEDPRQRSGVELFALADAVVACRRGQPAEAARVLGERWADCEGALKASSLRPLRVVRAFALASSETRDDSVVDNLVAESRPRWSGEYQFLTAVWPEMSTFVAVRDLT